jgi:hypothetical protein
MSEERLRRGTLPVAQRPVGVRWVAYWCGRTLQVLGLVLIVEVLLLFTGMAGMELLLYWSVAAVGVFYTGSACIRWAKGKR